MLQPLTPTSAKSELWSQIFCPIRQQAVVLHIDRGVKRWLLTSLQCPIKRLITPPEIGISASVILLQSNIVSNIPDCYYKLRETWLLWASLPSSWIRTENFLLVMVPISRQCNALHFDVGLMRLVPLISDYLLTSKCYCFWNCSNLERSNANVLPFSRSNLIKSWRLRTWEGILLQHTVSLPR